MSDHDDEQPLGERPELDLSYTHRDGRQVPFTVQMPSDEQVAKWRQWCEEYDRKHFGAATKPLEVINTSPGPEPSWPIGEHRLINEHADQHYRTSRAELWLLILTLAALLAVLAYLGVQAIGGAA